MFFLKKNFLILIFVFVNFFFLLAYLYRSTINITYGDQLYLVDLVVKEYVENKTNIFTIIKNMWTMGGIHRGVGGAVIALLNLKLFSFNSLFTIYFGSFVLFLTTLILFILYFKNLPINNFLTKILFIFISMIVLGLDQAELLTSESGASLFFRMLFFIITFIAFENFINKQTFKNIIFFIIPLFLNLFFFSGGYTIPFLISLIIILFFLYFINLSFLNKKFKLLILIEIILITFFVYFHGAFSRKLLYITEPQSQIIFPIELIFSQIFSFVKFFFLSLSANIISINLVTIAAPFKIPDFVLLVVAFVLLLSYICSTYLFFKNKIYKTTYLPLFFIVYTFLIYICIAITRYSYFETYPFYSMSSRYTLDTHYGLIGIIWIFAYSFNNKNYIFKKIRIKSNALLLIILFIVAGQIWTYSTEWKVGPYRKIYFNNLKEIALKREYSELNELKLFQKSDLSLVVNSLKFLDKNKLNVFHEK